MAKDNSYLLENPTEAFSMRFSAEHGPELVPLLVRKAKDEDRSLPKTIERILRQHFDAQNKKNVKRKRAV